MMLNSNTVYEPPPQWGCKHNWILIGYPILTWVTNEAGEKMHDGAPIMQKRQCLNCGGVEWSASSNMFI